MHILFCTFFFLALSMHRKMLCNGHIFDRLMHNSEEWGLPSVNGRKLLCIKFSLCLLNSSVLEMPMEVQTQWQPEEHRTWGSFCPSHVCWPDEGQLNKQWPEITITESVKTEQVNTSKVIYDKHLWILKHGFKMERVWMAWEQFQKWHNIKNEFQNRHRNKLKNNNE